MVCHCADAQIPLTIETNKVTIRNNPAQIRAMRIPFDQDSRCAAKPVATNTSEANSATIETH